MKKYCSLFRIQFIAALQYRAAAFAGLFTNCLWGLMQILAYAAFYKADPSAFPMEFSETASYIWMQQAFSQLFFLTLWDNEFPAMIESGAVAYQLARPIDAYTRWYCQSIAKRLAAALLRCWPILIVGFLMPAPYGIVLPPDLFQFVLFLLSVALSVSVVVAFSMLMYITVFYTLSARGMKLVLGQIAEFLSGAYIPLPFFPPDVRRIVELSPFAAMQNMPLRIYSGDMNTVAAFNGILLQLFWLIILVILGRVWMRISLKKVIVQGG